MINEDRKDDKEPVPFFKHWGTWYALVVAFVFSSFSFTYLPNSFHEQS
jgi:hypothetical protein